MSSSPSGTGLPSSSSTSCRSRLAITAPRVWMPTIAIWSPPLRSMISCAIRTSVRRRPSRSRTALLHVPLPGLGGLPRGRMPCLPGPFGLLLRKRAVVNEELRVVGDRDGRFARLRVPREDELPSGPRLAHDVFGADFAPAHGDRLTALEQAEPG